MGSLVPRAKSWLSCGNLNFENFDCVDIDLASGSDNFEPNVLGDLNYRGVEYIEWWGPDDRCPEFASLVIDFGYIGLVMTMRFYYYERTLLPL